MTPLVTVIIVSYNTRDMLARCLDSLRPETAEGDVRVVVVDNASHDGSPALVRARFPWVTLVESPTNLGFAAANNLALRALTTPYALLLNSDTEVAPGTVRALLDCMERHPSAGVVACRLLNTDGSLQRSCWRFPTPRRALAEALGLTRLLGRRSNYNEWDYASERPVDFAIGACLLLRKAAIDQTGIFDERFFMYSEEMDLTLRLARRGWETWYTPACSVVHHGGASGSANTPDQFLHARELYYEKWYGRSGLAILRISQAVGASLRLMGFGALSLLRPRPSIRAQVRRHAAMLRWVLHESVSQASESNRYTTWTRTMTITEEKVS